MNVMFVCFIVDDILIFIDNYKSILQKKKEIIDIENVSSKSHLYYKEQYGSSLRDEYIQIILSYGYIIQFCSSNPISLIFAFLHAMLARYIDISKFLKIYFINFIGKLVNNFKMDLKELE